ncbi:astacin-like metalloprotease toxin 1 [Parasteatoda tepidariorum]|uniref:astacin-like metalloprotease toxin 1 n=1 Tax=Parasteatoda tepidariorum TaxID=114398 RepID=UPI001C7292F4|nr:astacin-like metalloprotease toxin 1 [Parasteatoda tepidariorum]
MASTLILFILFIGCSSGHPIDDYDPINFPMENPDLFGGDMLGFDSEDRSAIVDNRQLWERGVVPFVEDPGLNKTVIRWILQKAFDQYQKNTCIKFVPRTTEKDYIRLFPGQGCYSNVGKTGGAQPVSLGENCGWEGAIVHELGHAIGFYHEQNRSDRDKYIRILWQNIRTGKEDQFFLLKPHENQLLTSFDYESIMLYGSLTFSKDWRAKLRTMETLDGGWLKDPMSKGKLSQKDIQRINMLYKCP